MSSPGGSLGSVRPGFPVREMGTGHEGLAPVAAIEPRHSRLGVARARRIDAQEAPLVADRCLPGPAAVRRGLEAVVLGPEVEIEVGPGAGDGLAGHVGDLERDEAAGPAPGQLPIASLAVRQVHAAIARQQDGSAAHEVEGDVGGIDVIGRELQPRPEARPRGTEQESPAMHVEPIAPVEVEPVGSAERRLGHAHEGLPPGQLRLGRIHELRPARSPVCREKQPSPRAGVVEDLRAVPELRDKLRSVYTT